MEVSPDACWHFAIANWSSPAFGGSSYYLVKSGGEVMISEANTMHLSGGAVIHEADFTSGQATAVPDPMDEGPLFRLIDARHLMLTGAEPGATLLLVDAAGRTVRTESLTGSNDVLDLAGLQNGVYAVSVVSGIGRYAHRFVVTD